MPEKTQRTTARRAAKRETNPELAEKLRTWSKTNLKNSDSYLNGLADALESGEDLAIWASTDVMQLFPNAYVRIRENKLHSYLNLLRNVMVFMPVALTWLAVGKATAAFASYTKTQAGGVANFLEFWQNGKGFLASEWTIGHVAFLDFLIIVTVIALSIVTPVLAQREEHKGDRANEQAERERISLMVEIVKYLFDKKEINNVTMNAQLARSIQSLRTATKTLSDSAKRIEKVAKQAAAKDKF